MTTTKFKTNIKCSACVEKVTPHLNERVGEGNWEVDLQDPKRTLTVNGDLKESDINESLSNTGYKVEEIKS